METNLENVKAMKVSNFKNPASADLAMRIMDIELEPRGSRDQRLEVSVKSKQSSLNLQISVFRVFTLRMKSDG